jgi:hypothetical protein
LALTGPVLEVSKKVLGLDSPERVVGTALLVSSVLSPSVTSVLGPDVGLGLSIALNAEGVVRENLFPDHLAMAAGRD